MRRRRTAHRFGDKRRTTDVLINEKVDFSGLMLSSNVLAGLKSAGFERPSPIQLKAIPLGRCGLDLIAQAKSGTGKTCVFSVIALENINLAVVSVQVLVLAPTREIAVQIKDVMCSIGQHLKGLKTHVFIGGMPLEDDKISLRQCHIAIGTPGRIKHLIESKLLQTTFVRLFILDEADKLLDESFQEQINWIYSTLPTSKQMLALSATYPDHLAERLKNYMKDPTFVRLNAADPALEGIRHYRSIVPFHSLPHKVFQEKVESLLHLFSKLSFHQCLIFSNYQIRAKNLSETLAKNGWPSTYISGSQGQSERLSAMAKLKDFKCRIMISTDLTSRGIDAERVNLVINMDLPHDSETYLHRVGRAGRFGSYGVAINFVAEGKEVTSLKEIEDHCGVMIAPLPDDISTILSEEALNHSQEISETKNTNIKTQDKSQILVGNMENREETNDNHQKTGENRIVEDKRTMKIEENNDVERKIEENNDVERKKTANTTDNEFLEKNNKIEFSKSALDKKQEKNESMNVTNEKMEENENVEVELVQEKIHHEVEVDGGTRSIEIQGSTEVQVEAAKCNLKYNEVKVNPKLNGHNDVEELFHMSNLGDALETKSIESDFLKNNIPDYHKEKLNESRSQMIFRNFDTDESPRIEQLNGDCFVSDESWSEYESSDETGSSGKSYDSHVPLSCKDFDNVFYSYLKARGGGYSKNSKTSLENETKCLDESSSVDNTISHSRGEIARDDVSYTRESGPLLSIKENAIARENPVHPNAVAEEGSVDANEASANFTAIATNDCENLEETMFYGATPDDVTAYMAELPIAWTNTWYRVYDRQTKFIMKYTKFSHENF